jgi:hypothetical protein
VATIQVIEKTAPGTDADGWGYVDVGPYGRVGDVSVIMGDYPSPRDKQLIEIKGRSNWGGTCRVRYKGPPNHPHFGVLVETW